MQASEYSACMHVGHTVMRLGLAPAQPRPPVRAHAQCSLRWQTARAATTSWMKPSSRPTTPRHARTVVNAVNSRGTLGSERVPSGCTICPGRCKRATRPPRKRRRSLQVCRCGTLGSPPTGVTLANAFLLPIFHAGHRAQAGGQPGGRGAPGAGPAAPRVCRVRHLWRHARLGRRRQRARRGAAPRLFVARRLFPAALCLRCRKPRCRRWKRSSRQQAAAGPACLHTLTRRCNVAGPPPQARWIKLCKETRLIGRGLTSTDCDLMFAKVRMHACMHALLRPMGGAGLGARQAAAGHAAAPAGMCIAPLGMQCASRCRLAHPAVQCCAFLWAVSSGAG